MTKTPEQMAQDKAYELGSNNVEFGVAKDAFLAGYQAAMNSPEKQDSCEHILDMEKMVDVDKVMFCVYCNDMHKGNCAVGKGKNHPALSQPQWISVKDRLPEIPENDYSNRVLLLRADRFIVIARIEKCVRFVRPLQEALIVETDNGDPIEEFTHWMPMPKLPEEK